MTNTTKKTAIVFLLAGIALHTSAQTNASKWQAAINGGVFIYQGDLTPSIFGSYKTPSPVLGLNVSRVLTPSFALRGNIVAGILRGDDAAYKEPIWRQQRSLSFTTTAVELSALLVWNLFGNNRNELGLRLSPYLFAGAGASWINAIKNYSRFNKSFFADGSAEQVGLAADILTRPSRIIPVIPMGAGVEYYISPKISLTVETNFRYTFSDYIDGYSYVANPKRKDFYHSHTIGLLYRFSGKNQTGCPVMKY
jgi:hypothetical protein